MTNLSTITFVLLMGADSPTDSGVENAREITQTSGIAICRVLAWKLATQYDEYFFCLEVEEKIK